MSDERRRDVTDPSPGKPSERLLTLEREIDEGLEQFVRVGRALRTIRNERLYEERDCATFEVYVKNVWEHRLSQRYAVQLIEAARAHEALRAIARKQPKLLPQTEGAMRPFTALLPRDPEYAESRERGWRPDSERHLKKTGRLLLADPRVAQEQKPPTAKVVAEHVSAELRALEEAGTKPAPEVADRPRAEVIERIRAAPVTVELGDLYQVGPHRLICGDATEPAVYRRLLGPVRPGLLFTDPPYNQGYGGGRGRDPFNPIPNDDLSPEDAARLLTFAYTVARTHLDDHAAGYVCAPSADSRLLARFLGVLHASEQAVEVAGLPGPRGWGDPRLIIWNKLSIGPGPEQGYRHQHEALLHLRGTGEWYGGTLQDDVEDVWPIARPPKPYIHPNEKPCELAQRAMLNSTPHGEGVSVLDPFLGSGSTVIAAHLLARKHGWEESPVYGIELEPEIMEVALRWIEHHTGYERELLERAPVEDDEEGAWREALGAWDAKQWRWLAKIGRQPDDSFERWLLGKGVRLDELLDQWLAEELGREQADGGD